MISIYAIIDRELGQTVQVFPARNKFDAIRSFRALPVNSPMVPIDQLDLVYLADISFSPSDDTEYLHVKNAVDSSFDIASLPLICDGSEVAKLVSDGLVLPNGCLKEVKNDDDPAKV